MGRIDLAKSADAVTAHMGQQISENLDRIDDEDSFEEAIEEFLERTQLPRKNEVLASVPTKLITIENLPHREVDTTSEEFLALKGSIAREGLLQPPTVAYVDGKIKCIFGAHRISACLSLDMPKITCVFLPECSESSLDDKRFMENHARKSNHPLVTATWIERQKKKHGLSNTELAERLGKDREWVRRFEKIANWPVETKAYIQANERSLNETFLLNVAKRRAGINEIMALLETKVAKDDAKLRFKRKEIDSKEYQALIGTPSQSKPTTKPARTFAGLFKKHKALKKHKKEIDIALRYFGVTPPSE